jgi:hypothetical protein
LDLEIYACRACQRINPGAAVVKSTPKISVVFFEVKDRKFVSCQVKPVFHIRPLCEQRPCASSGPSLKIVRDGRGGLTGHAVDLGSSAWCKLRLRHAHLPPDAFGFGCGSLSPTTRCAPHQFRTRNDLIEPQQTRTKSNKDAAKSMKLIDSLPLITVWLQVRVLPGPPQRRAGIDILDFLSLKLPPPQRW